MDFGAGGKRRACIGVERGARAALAALWTSVSPMAAVWPADARAQSEAVEFDIPSQPIASALVAFARQAGVEFVMSAEASSGAPSNPVRGALDREQALAMLLEGTEYEARLENGAIRLLRTRRRGADNEYDGELVQLAQADATQTNDGAPPRERRRREEEAEEGEIVVVGTNIRGVYPASSPVEIYTAEDIARTGATTTEQFIQKLPQSFGTRTEFGEGLATLAPNREGVNGADLRGLGVGTTLTLLNGRRLALVSSGQAVDLSMIPASLVARVEVLTDGASAIYGSDAVGGVVNFVLREDFEGAETTLTYGGVTDGSLRRGGLSQTFGRRWRSGNALVSYDFLSASALDAADRSYSAPAAPGTLTPHDSRHSALMVLSQDLGDRIELNGEFLYSSRDVKSTSTSHEFFDNNISTANTQQYFANLGADFQVTDSLNASLLASFGDVDVDGRSLNRRNATGAVSSIGILDTNYSALDLTAKIDGELFALRAGSLRFSLGVGYLDEQFRGTNSAGSRSSRDLGRSTSYAFGELLAPLVGSEQQVPLVDRLELTLAARYTAFDDTSSPSLGRDFGEDVVPKFGLLWGVTPELSFRATYGESFRAPSLTELDPTFAANNIISLPIGGVPSTAFAVRGPSVDLEPEAATSYTIGGDYRSSAHPGFELSATYFNIEYVNRIASPNPTPALADPAAWPDVVYRPSSAAQIEELLRTTPNISNRTGISLSDPHAASLELFALPNFWIADVRFRNLALTTLDGLDFSISSRFSTSWGEISIGGQVTRILSYHEQVTQTAPVNTIVDTVLRPADLRALLYAGFTHGDFDHTLSINYVDDYNNPQAPGGARHVDSWITVDWNTNFQFSGDADRRRSGWRARLSVQNVFDEPPPFVILTSSLQRSSIGFDPANANPFGRQLTLAVARGW